VKERVQPAGRQAARIFRPASLSSPTAHQAAVLESLGEIRGALGDMSGLLDRLAPTVIAQKTVQLDANGTAFDQFRIPFRSIGVDYFGAGTLTVSAAPLGVGAPGPGVGIAKVGPGGFAVCNMRSTVVSFYGSPGDFVTFTAYGLPQAPCGVASASAVVTETQAANPAAGQPYTYTVPPGGPTMELVSFRGTLTTDATVANRNISLAVVDANAVSICQVNNPQAVVASTSLQVNFLATVTSFQTSASGTSILPIPMRTLLPGWSLKLNAGNMDAGDQWSQLAVVVTD
jgi:hypothetical protein